MLLKVFRESFDPSLEGEELDSQKVELFIEQSNTKQYHCLVLEDKNISLTVSPMSLVDKFVVQFEDKEAQYELVHLEEGTTEVIAQGQQVPMENKYLTSKDITLEVANYFIKNVLKHPKYKWELSVSFVE